MQAVFITGKGWNTWNKALVRRINDALPEDTRLRTMNLRHTKRNPDGARATVCDALRLHPEEDLLFWYSGHAGGSTHFSGERADGALTFGDGPDHAEYSVFPYDWLAELVCKRSGKTLLVIDGCHSRIAEDAFVAVGTDWSHVTLMTSTDNREDVSYGTVVSNYILDD